MQTAVVFKPPRTDAKLTTNNDYAASNAEYFTKYFGQTIRKKLDQFYYFLAPFANALFVLTSQVQAQVQVYTLSISQPLRHVHHDAAATNSSVSTNYFNINVCILQPVTNGKCFKSDSLRNSHHFATLFVTNLASKTFPTAASGEKGRTKRRTLQVTEITMAFSETGLLPSY